VNRRNKLGGLDSIMAEAGLRANSMDDVQRLELCEPASSSVKRNLLELGRRQTNSWLGSTSLDSGVKQ
jgi:hypothetical protein